MTLPAASDVVMGMTRRFPARALLVTVATLAAVVLPGPPATAETPAATSCHFIARMHFSTGIHINELHTGNTGNFTLASSLLVCDGSLTGTGALTANGSYTDP